MRQCSAPVIGRSRPKRALSVSAICPPSGLPGAAAGGNDCSVGPGRRDTVAAGRRSGKRTRRWAGLGSAATAGSEHRLAAAAERDRTTCAVAGAQSTAKDSTLVRMKLTANVKPPRARMLIAPFLTVGVFGPQSRQIQAGPPQVCHKRSPVLGATTKDLANMPDALALLQTRRSLKALSACEPLPDRG